MRASPRPFYLSSCLEEHRFSELRGRSLNGSPPLRGAGRKPEPAAGSVPLAWRGCWPCGCALCSKAYVQPICYLLAVQALRQSLQDLPLSLGVRLSTASLASCSCSLLEEAK